MKNQFAAIVLSLFCATAFGQNVGIGTTEPAYRLDVNGSTRTNGNLLVNNFVGIGTTEPLYKLQVNDGSLALYNTADNLFWTMNYNPAGNYLAINYEGTPRMVFENSGNVGILVANPLYRLDVSGSIHASNNLIADGNATIDGSLTVNGGRGIIRNATSANQLKYHTFEVTYATGNLAGHGQTGEGNFSFAAAGFTAAPSVMVGDIVSTGGTTGQLYRVILMVYGCTSTGCKVRLVNTSPNPVNYEITWNIVCIGR